MRSPAEVMTALHAALDDLAGVDRADLAGADAVELLHRELHRLEAVTTRAVAAFDAAGSWEPGRARSAAAWLVRRCRLPRPLARRRVRLGRVLRHMPEVESAWLSGDVGEAQVAVLAAARTPRRPRCSPVTRRSWWGTPRRPDLDRDLVRVVDVWSQLADPDGVEACAARQREGRRLHLSQSFEGTWFLDGVLDPVSGEAVAEALRRIEDELFEADWADAKARCADGDEPRLSDLGRTPPQRRADALVEMARPGHGDPGRGRA